MLCYYFCKVITVAIKFFYHHRSLRADAQRLQQANRADTERLQKENRSIGIRSISLVYLFYMEPTFFQVTES